MKEEKGQIAIIATISIMTILLSVIFFISFISVDTYKTSTNDLNKEQAQLIAESGVENALELISQNVSYTGGTFTTPSGTASVTVTGPTSGNYTITSQSVVGKVTFKTQAVATKSPPAAITQFAVFSDNTITGIEGTVTGDMQTNNQIYWESGSVEYGSIWAAAQGGGEKDYIDSSQVLVNPNTGIGGNIHIWNNIYVQNSSKVQNIAEYHDSIKVDGTSTVGDPTKNPTLNITPINTPVFNYNYWKNLAQTNGTYYSNFNSFNSSILTNSSYSSVSGGVDTHTIPAGVYYIDDNVTLPSNDSSGNQNSYNFTGSTIISTNTLQVLSGLTMNSTYENAPALVGSTLLTIATGLLTDLTPQVNITGVIFSDQSVIVQGASTVSPSNHININGASWSGLYTLIGVNGYVNYNQSVVTSLNVNAFNIPPQVVSVISWNQVN